MKLGDQLDETDRRILAELQEDCKAPLAHVGKRVGLSAPSVMERIRKLEEAGIIRGYHATLNSRKVGLDVTAFIGVSMSPNGIDRLESQLENLEEVLECHHVTGAYTMLLKVKTQNTETLERLISRIRLIDGVIRTETLVVLSTLLERTQVPVGIPIGVHGAPVGVRAAEPPVTKRHNGTSSTREPKVSTENE